MGVKRKFCYTEAQCKFAEEVIRTLSKEMDGSENQWERGYNAGLQFAILYNMYRTNSHSSNKHIRVYGCSGSEYVPSGEIDWVCKNRCEWYRPEIVDAYASDKALWRR